MKYCPTCQTRYDEEIIRFCTKDGTPLVSEEEQNFIEMPSESLAEQRVEEEDDPSEVTIVRNNVSAPPPVPDDDMNFDAEPAQRIVVPTEPAPTGYGAMPSRTTRVSAAAKIEHIQGRRSDISRHRHYPGCGRTGFLGSGSRTRQRRKHEREQQPVESEHERQHDDRQQFQFQRRQYRKRKQQRQRKRKSENPDANAKAFAFADRIADRNAV